jgi:hypothetical protein
MTDQELTRFETKWRELSNEGLEVVFRIAETKENFSFSLQQYTKLYTLAYDICNSTSSHTMIGKCYDRLLETIKLYCMKKFQNMQQRFNKQPLLDFVENWETFEGIILKWILKFFSYLV